jgi:hypothetical protein
MEVGATDGILWGIDDILFRLRYPRGDATRASLALFTYPGPHYPTLVRWRVRRRHFFRALTTIGLLSIADFRSSVRDFTT